MEARDNFESKHVIPQLMQPNLGPDRQTPQCGAAGMMPVVRNAIQPGPGTYEIVSNCRRTSGAM